MFRNLAGVSTCVLLLSLPLLAWAHATPTMYAPAASETVLETPELVSIQFTERIERDASSVAVYGPQGEAVSEGKGNIDVNDQRLLSVPIKDDGEGVYTVSWQVVSVDDGHFTKGAYSFLVNSEGLVYEDGEETVFVAYSTALPDVVASFFNLLGESLFIALLFLLLASVYLRKEVVARAVLVHLVVVGLLFFCFGALLGIVRKTLELGMLQNTSFVDALLVYGTSSIGMAGFAKILLACIFTGVFLCSLRKRSLAAFGGLGVSLGVILCVQSFISHAAASLFVPHVSIAVTLVHLFAKELVIGGTVVLCVLFFFFLKEKKLEQYLPLAHLYDVIASLALLFAASSGAFITWLHLKDSMNLSLTSWGRLFLVLLAFTCVLGAFRLFHQLVVHRYFTHPRLQKIYAVTLPIEALLALVVLFYSGYISMTTPPFTVEAYTYAQSVSSHGVAIDLDVHPYEQQLFRITLSDETNREHLDPQSLIVFALQTDLGIGPNVIPTQKRSDGVYVFSQSELNPSGTWNIHVSGSFNGRYDALAQFVLTYPDDVNATMYSNDVRSWDTLASIVTIVALISFGFFSFLFLSAIKTAQKSMLGAQTMTSYSWTYALMSLVCFAFITLGLHFGSQTSFERTCLKEGFLWQMGYPTRDFEATSKNALLGCTVHEGHYHFIDEREFNAYLMNAQ